MALKPGSIIRAGKFLSVNDYIQSPNRLFFAIMQSDGNFVVYHGSGPSDNHGFLWDSGKAPGAGQYFAIMQDDGNFVVYRGTSPSDNRGFLWDSGKAPGAGQYFAIMQDDGNFVVYRGTGPSDNRGFLWASMVIDPVVDIKISSVEYDVAAAKTLKSAPAELFRQVVHNQTTETQTSSISGSASVDETSGWSDSLGVNVGVSTDFEAGIPLVAEGKVSVSVDVTNTYTWNGSTTKTKTWAFDTPVTDPPHTTIVGLVAATLSTIAVPYTLKGTVILKSGTRLPGSITGVYTGSNSHDLTVTFIQQDPVTSQIRSTTEALKALPA